MKQTLSLLEQSLEKKLLLLDGILEKSRDQEVLLKDEELDPDQFEQNVEEKAALVEQLIELDAGFEQVYARIKEDLPKQKEQ